MAVLIGQSGQVEFSAVTEETVNLQNDVTSHAVESSADISDHVKDLPDEITITGVVAGEDAAEKISRLRWFRRKGEVLTYKGRNLFSNLVIVQLTTRHHVRVRDGFEFDITLRRINVAKLAEVQIAKPTKAAGSKANTQTKKVSNKGRQQPAKRGSS